ncbi:MAG: hypothetical protein L6Q99_21820 [Planctomycetes bacterium]|nr:hypothetical protein [Planctomycetota bacterium]
MRGWAVALALFASAAILVLESVALASPFGVTDGPSGAAFAPNSRVGWVAYVWCAALALLPSSRDALARRWSTTSVLALALPVFALAFASDVRSGGEPLRVATLTAFALATFAAWSTALARASVVFAATVWSGLALGAPLLVAALEWAAAADGARAPLALRLLASASPLAWCHELAAGTLPLGWRAVPIAPLAAAFVVGVLGARVAPGSGARSAAGDAARRSHAPSTDSSGAAE